MKLEKVTIRLGETIPVAQFANVRPEIEITISSTDNGQSYTELYATAKKLASELFEQVKGEMLGIKPKAAPITPVSVPGAPPPYQPANMNHGGVHPVVNLNNGMPVVNKPTW